MAAQTNRLQTMRNRLGTMALVYSANGRAFRLNVDQLSVPVHQAYWYNPRTGYWNVAGVEHSERQPFQQDFSVDTTVLEFNPPGEPGQDNDWVLLLQGKK